MRWPSPGPADERERAAGRARVERGDVSHVRVFVSFDLAHDGDLKDRLVDESLRPGSPFAIAARSEAADGERMRSGIAASDEVIVICGMHTEGSAQVSAEVRIAQEEHKPYFLLWGRREVMCTRPAGAKPGDAMYSWTWNILHDQVLATLRNSQPREVPAHYKKP